MYSFLYSLFGIVSAKRDLTHADFKIMLEVLNVLYTMLLTH